MLLNTWNTLTDRIEILTIADDSVSIFCIEWSFPFPCVETDMNVARTMVQILDTPSLLADASSGAKKNIFKQKAPEADAAASGCC